MSPLNALVRCHCINLSFEYLFNTKSNSMTRIWYSIPEGDDHTWWPNPDMFGNFVPLVKNTVSTANVTINTLTSSQLFSLYIKGNQERSVKSKLWASVKAAWIAANICTCILTYNLILYFVR